EYAQKAAMERHAAFPEPEDVERVGGELIETVEEHVAHASTEDHSQRGIEDEVVDLGGTDRRTGPCRAATGEPPRPRETHEVHEPVPADGQRAELQGDGIESGILPHAR